MFENKNMHYNTTFQEKKLHNKEAKTRLGNIIYSL